MYQTPCQTHHIIIVGAIVNKLKSRITFQFKRGEYQMNSQKQDLSVLPRKPLFYAH